MTKKKINVKKAIKKSNPNRNAIALELKKTEALKIKKTKILVQEKDYIRNLFNGEYYLARMNMIADQLNSKDIKETIDGCVKTEEYLRSEYFLMRMQALEGFRNCNEAKRNLKDSGCSDEEIKAMKLAWCTEKVIQEQ